MKRSLLQVYVKDADKAICLYQQAFDAAVLCRYADDDGVILHCELDLYGQVLALSERNDANAVHSRQTITGNTMQFCLHFGEGNAACVEKAYDALKTDATVLVPLAPCAFSPLMAALIDPYGVSWCLFV